MNPKKTSHIFTFFTTGIMSALFAIALSCIGPGTAAAQSENYSAAQESVYPVRLDLQLTDMKTKVLGSPIIKNINNQYTIVESTFTARARAFGGDIYLPSYREDVVSEAVITIPEEGSNAIVPGVSTIEILGDLPLVKGKFLLREYEETTIRIRVSYKILPKAMPSRLIFATKLNTVLSYPAAYENGLNDPGLDPATGERLLQIPLINATYIPQQVTRVDWKTEPVILFKESEKLSLIKKIFLDNGFSATSMASVATVAARKTEDLPSPSSMHAMPANQASAPGALQIFLKLFR